MKRQLSPELEKAVNRSVSTFALLMIAIFAQCASGVYLGFMLAQ